MKAVVIASGSSGNSTIIFNNKTKILIDFGMQYNYIYNELKDINIDINDIDALLITHTHIDHVKGLESLIKKTGINIYVTEELKKELQKKYPNGKYIILTDITKIDTISVKYFKTSHDCDNSLGYILEEKQKSIVYLTDTGCIKENIYKEIKNKSMYIIESNHDIEMLCNGKYPYQLKKRILSDKGHLSNIDVSEHLIRLIGKNTNTIVLAHISKENNTEEKALQELKNKLIENNKSIKTIIAAKQNKRTDIINI